MKKSEKNPMVTEFVQNLNDDRLYYLLDFVFKSKPAGYLADLCDFMVRESGLSGMDHWLKSAVSGDQFFDRIDVIEAAVLVEIELREESRRQKDRKKNDQG